MKKRFLSVLAVFICSIPISAQVFTNPIPPQINMQNQIWRNFKMGQIGNQMAADMARASLEEKKRTGKTNKTAPVSKPSSNNSTVYQKQFAFQRVENSPLAQKIIEAQKGNSADLAKMRQIVNYLWGKYEMTFADENKRLGMPFDDTVSAMTYFIVASYLYANDIASLDSENSVAVYKQVAAILSKDQEFNKLQPTDKQLFAELLVTMGGMPVVTFEQNRNKTELKNLGMANLERIFGDKAKSLQITQNGVEF